MLRAMPANSAKIEQLIIMINNEPEIFDTLIIGSGLAGLSAANKLAKNGSNIIVIDKGRGVGGRLASRRIGEAVFDHGAQFINLNFNFVQSKIRILDRTDTLTFTFLTHISEAFVTRAAEWGPASPSTPTPSPPTRSLRALMRAAGATPSRWPRSSILRTMSACACRARH